MQNVAWHHLAEIRRGVHEKDVTWIAAYVAAKPAPPYITYAKNTKVYQFEH